jgi:hypothetical protein
MAKNNNQMSGWVGWVAFAGLMLIVAGFFHILAGVVALFKHDVYVAGASNVWVLNYTTWGWLHIVGGLIALYAGSALLQGKTWARILVVIVAVLSAIANMAFVPIYPVWSLLIITVDILIIFAVTVHGRELDV